MDKGKKKKNRKNQVPNIAKGKKVNKEKTPKQKGVKVAIVKEMTGGYKTMLNNTI